MMEPAGYILPKVSYKQGWGRCNRSNRKVIDLLKFKCNSNRLKFFKCNSNRLQSNRFFLLHFLLLSITLNDFK